MIAIFSAQSLLQDSLTQSAFVEVRVTTVNLSSTPPSLPSCPLPFPFCLFLLCSSLAKRHNSMFVNTAK